MTWASSRGRRAAFSALLMVSLVLALGGCASVDQRLQRAAQLEDRGDYAAALDGYEDAIVHVGASDRKQLAAIYVKVGECLWRLGRPNEAVNAFERALQLDPVNVDAHLRTAELWVTQAPGRALGEARFVLSLEPNNVEAFTVLGAAYSSAGQVAPAKQAYERVLAGSVRFRAVLVPSA